MQATIEPTKINPLIDPATREAIKTLIDKGALSAPTRALPHVLIEGVLGLPICCRCKTYVHLMTNEASCPVV